MKLPQRMKLAADTGDFSLLLTTDKEKIMESIEAKIQENRAHVAGLEQQRDALLVPYAGGDKSVAPRLDEIEKALSAANTDLARLRGAQARIAAERAAEAAAAEAAALAQRWEDAKRIAARREKIAADFEEGAAKMVQALKESVATGLQLRECMPTVAPYLFEDMGPDMVSANARIHLLKLGLRWAHSFPWPTDDKPTFSEAVAAQNAAALSGSAK